MRRSTLWIGSLTLLLVFVAMPASAGGVHFSIGTGFHVGGLSFHIAYASPGHGYAPYYYRTRVHLSYHGHHCTDYCFRQAGYYYHEPYCPVVSYHFGLYGYQVYGYPGYGYYPGPVYGPPIYYVPRYDRRHHHRWYRPRHHHQRHRYYGHDGRRDRHHRGGYRSDRPRYNEVPGSAGKTRPPRRRDDD